MQRLRHALREYFPAALEAYSDLAAPDTLELLAKAPDPAGKKTAVLARFVHNDRLIDALHSQAFAALSASPGARAYHDRIRTRDVGHHAALRQLANRLVGILHGCLKTDTFYDETTAWNYAEQPAA